MPIVTFDPEPRVMTLKEKQFLFCSRLLPLLLAWPQQHGYTATTGEAWRSNEEAARLHSLGKGLLLSLHCDRLAIDLNLFKDGDYQEDSAVYQALGEYWESLSEAPAFECCWGGRFLDDQGKPKPDGDHFSIAHGGRK